MKPQRTFPCRCGRGPATSRCEDREGVKWLCGLCVAVWWQAIYDRAEAA